MGKERRAEKSSNFDVEEYWERTGPKRAQLSGIRHERRLRPPARRGRRHPRRRLNACLLSVFNREQWRPDRGRQQLAARFVHPRAVLGRGQLAEGLRGALRRFL